MSETRRLSLKEDLMHSRTNLQLYGLLRCLSTAKPTEDQSSWKEYLPKSTLTKAKKLLLQACGITSRTFTRHLNDLLAEGLVQEGTFLAKEKELPCYYFPYDYNGIYKLVDKQLLFYLVSSGNGITLRIYLYLLNKSGLKEDYEFTKKELAEALGFSASYRDRSFFSLLENNLISLQKNKIISYSSTTIPYVTDIGTTVPKPTLILHAIATQLPPDIEFEQKELYKMI